MHATDIVAYTYQAETLCPPCTMAAMSDAPAIPGADAEIVLDFVAQILGVDRDDESSFDSGDFPKVIFGSQIEDIESCGQCGEEL